MVERRGKYRANVQFRVHFRSGVLEGRATLADLSTKGARLEEATTQPQLGAEVELEIELEPLPVITVQGFVARRTWGGFAVAFGDADAELERFVADAASLV